MVTFAVLALVVGVLWLAASLVGFVFKLTFAVIGAVTGLLAGMAGLVVGGLALLLVAPLLALALLPLMAPLLLAMALVWWMVRAARGPARAPLAASR